MHWKAARAHTSAGSFEAEEAPPINGGHASVLLYLAKGCYQLGCRLSKLARGSHRENMSGTSLHQAGGKQFTTHGGGGGGGSKHARIAAELCTPRGVNALQTPRLYLRTLTMAGRVLLAGSWLMAGWSLMAAGRQNRSEFIHSFSTQTGRLLLEGGPLWPGQPGPPSPPGACSVLEGCAQR